MAGMVNSAAEPIPCFAAPPSWDDMQISDTVRKGVVFLGWKEGDKFTPKATGFIMRAREGDWFFGYVVTAQHCIASLFEPDEAGNPRDVRISVNRHQGPPALIKTEYTHWWHHPDPQQNVDVVVAAVGLDERIYDYTWGAVEAYTVTDELIKQKEIGVGDEVAVVGLFRNHTGRRKNIPIVRIGNIAAMPEEPVWTRYGNIEAYLIEARSIGGLSGSPVFVALGSWRRINNAYVFQGGGLSFYLLGLMHGHFDVKDLNADVVLDLEDASTGIHSGIGVVVPASKIAETIMQKDLVAERKAAVEKEKSNSTVVPDFASEREPVGGAQADEPNPNHLEDFTRLVDVAARKNRTAN